MAERRAHREPTVCLDDFTVALQPVVNLTTGETYGFEALLRGPQGIDVNPPAVFRRARREGWLAELESRARELAFTTARRFLCEGEVLFLNGDVRFPIAADRYPNVVLEISEERNVDSKLIAQRQREGVALFLDDYGASHGNLSRLLEVRPAGIKVDRGIVQGLSSDPRRFAVAKTLAGLAQELGIIIVAEGIETPDDLAAVQRAGFAFAQGYLLGRPHLAPNRSALRLMQQRALEIAGASRLQVLEQPQPASAVL